MENVNCFWEFDKIENNKCFFWTSCNNIVEKEGINLSFDNFCECCGKQIVIDPKYINLAVQSSRK